MLCPSGQTPRGDPPGASGSGVRAADATASNQHYDTVGRAANPAGECPALLGNGGFLEPFCTETASQPHYY